MKMKMVGLALFAAAFYGCADRPASPPSPAPEPAAGIEVDAPGVHVEAGGGKGIEVEAPGADVEVPPK